MNNQGIFLWTSQRNGYLPRKFIAILVIALVEVIHAPTGQVRLLGIGHLALVLGAALGGDGDVHAKPGGEATHSIDLVILADEGHAHVLHLAADVVFRGEGDRELPFFAAVTR